MVSIQKTVWQICSKRLKHITNSTLNFIRSDSNLLFWADITGHADYLTQDTYVSLLVRDQSLCLMSLQTIGKKEASLSSAQFLVIFHFH